MLDIMMLSIQADANLHLHPPPAFGSSLSRVSPQEDERHADQYADASEHLRTNVSAALCCDDRAGDWVARQDRKTHDRKSHAHAGAPLPQISGQT